MPSNTGYLRHFLACNNYNPSGFVPFFIDGKSYGRIKRGVIDILLETSLFIRHEDGISLRPEFDNFDSRSEALQMASEMFSVYFGRTFYNEVYGINEAWGEQPVAQLDRAAVPWFGVRAWGIHVNGFVRKDDGIHLWIGRRSSSRSSYAGQLDNMIGGGQPVGLTLEQNLCKEAKEEAGVDNTLACTAKAVGKVTYMFERSDGLRNDTLFIYDLELKDDFVPRNTDGEVESFSLMPLKEVAKIICETDRFKFNCNLVIMDFMMRHHFLTSEHAEYNAIHRWLSGELCRV